MAYFGDTLAHAALLGVAFGLLLELNITLAVFIISSFFAVLLMVWQRNSLVPADALLGILSHGALALGLLALSFMTWIRFDLTSLLFGDILAVTRIDIALIYAGGGIVLVVLCLIWKRLFAATVSIDIAEAEGTSPQVTNIIFTLLLATTIAISLKIVGALLITAMLIIPAAAARRFAINPESMAIVAAVIGCFSVIAGLFASLEWDTPSGPSIVFAATLVFIISMTPLVRWAENTLKPTTGASRD